MFVTADIKIVGVTPLMLHNGQTADPLNKWARLIQEISKIRTKSEQDHLELARREWFAALYTNDSGQICIPGENLEATFVEAAKKKKLGKQSKTAILCDGLFILTHKGPKDLEALYEIPEFSIRSMVRVQSSRCARTRPVFNEWSLDFQLSIEADRMNPKQTEDIWNIAGQQIGLCERRPKYGRFDVEEFTWQK